MSGFTLEDINEKLRVNFITICLSYASWRQEGSSSLIKSLREEVVGQDVDLILLSMDDEDDEELAIGLGMTSIPCANIYKRGGKLYSSLNKEDLSLEKIKHIVSHLHKMASTISPSDSENVLTQVSDLYAKTLEGSERCCVNVNSAMNGYSLEELALAGATADLGLGCGNPLSFAELKQDEIVVDLGSGGGIDCFIAGKQVGPNGKVIGVDMTPNMVHQARKNAKEGGHDNVSFRLGEIEYLPVADNFADVVISNCVVNLSPDKGQVLKEVYRVLKPNGGRVAICDVVMRNNTKLPDHLKTVEAMAC